MAPISREANNVLDKILFHVLLVPLTQVFKLSFRASLQQSFINQFNQTKQEAYRQCEGLYIYLLVITILLWLCLPTRSSIYLF